jgi:foldase protein PrsA
MSASIYSHTDDYVKVAHIAMQTTVDASKQALERRRAPARKAVPAQQAAQTGRRSVNWRLMVLLLAVLVVGAAIGALLARQRYKAKEQEVIAAVNGVTIRKDNFYRRLELASGQRVIQQMVREELQLQYARKLGVTPTAAEIAQKYDEARKQPNFEQKLMESGLTADEYKRNIGVALAQAKAVNRGVSVSDAEVRRFYNANCDPKNPNARYYKPEMVQPQAIVTETEDEARRAILDLNRDLVFSTVAKTYSKDVSKENGGMLPAVYRGRSNLDKVPGMEQALFAMKVGETLGPKRFANAWWIIRCLDKKAAHTQPFDEVKEECRLGALLAKGLPVNGAKVQSDFQEFARKSNLQAFWGQYKSAITAP